MIVHVFRYHVYQKEFLVTTFMHTHSVFQMDAKLPHQQALRECYRFCVDNVRATDVTDFLIEGGFLSLDEIEKLGTIPAERVKTRELLNMLMKKPEAAFRKLIFALQETSTHHVVEELEKKLAAIQDAVDQQHTTCGKYEFAQLHIFGLSTT